MTDGQTDRQTDRRTGDGKERAIAYMLSRAKNRCERATFITSSLASFVLHSSTATFVPSRASSMCAPSSVVVPVDASDADVAVVVAAAAGWHDSRASSLSTGSGSTHAATKAATRYQPSRCRRTDPAACRWVTTADDGGDDEDGMRPGVDDGHVMAPDSTNSRVYVQRPAKHTSHVTADSRINGLYRTLNPNPNPSPFVR